MDSRLIKRLEIIEKEIAEISPENPNHQWLQKVTGISRNLDDLSPVKNLLEPINDLLSRGGKRWRPLVLGLCCEASGGGYDGYRFAPVVEIPHNGTLIVDDIEDKSLYRRGGAAIHTIYGDDVSINGANFVYFLPTLCIEDSDISPERKNLLFSIFHEEMRRVHAGQSLDIFWHNNVNVIPSIDDYFSMCRFKTGSLARMAARIGVAVAGMEREASIEIGDLWESVGVGFQIYDDILNLTKGNPGKKRGDDIVERKKSLPVILFCRKNLQGSAELFPLLEEASRLGIDDGADSIEKAIVLLEQSGVIDRAKEYGETILADARSGIADFFQNKASVDSTSQQREAAELQLSLIDSFLDSLTS